MLSRAFRAVAVGLAALVAATPMACIIFGEADRLIIMGEIVGDQAYLFESPESDFVRFLGWLYCIAAPAIGFAATFTLNLRLRFKLAFWSGVFLLCLVCICALHDFLAGPPTKLGAGLAHHAEHGMLLLEYPVPIIYAWSTFTALLVLIYAIQIPYERNVA